MGRITSVLRAASTQDHADSIIVTTTPSIDGRRVVRYAGLVTGEAILGANIFKDLFAGIRDLVGGRSATYERELRNARDIAVTELRQAAAELGANAVVGVDIDYETVGGSGSMLMVSVSGRPSWSVGR
jgi:uncharacterized protein YbjQ (UPF0145 family)